MSTFSVKQLLNKAAAVDSAVQVKGWVRSRRDSKAGISFIALSDGSCFDTLQIVAESKLANYDADVLRLTKDCAVVITGAVVESLGVGQVIEILAHTIEVI